MSNGILERIEAMLTILVARDTSADFTAEIVGTLADTSENNKSLAAEESTGVEVDNKSTPWDARIHTSNKGKTQKGVWKRKPSLDDEFFKTVMDEIYITTQTEDEIVDTGETDTVDTPIKKVAPTKPGKKVAPTKPGKKGPPTKPGKSDDNKFKAQALKNISILTEKFGASFESVTANLLSKHGVDTFDSLPKEHHSEVYDSTVEWLKSLELLSDEVDVLNQVSKDSEHVDDINEGIESFISEAGGEGAALGSVPMDALSALIVEMTDYADEWDKFFKDDE